jgi:hypothetical protein
MDKDKAIRSAKLTAAGILDKARARTAVTRAGGQIAPSKYLPNVPRAVHADGGKVAYHATQEPFENYDWGRLGQSTKDNTFGTSEEDWALSLANLGPWSHEKPLSKRIGMNTDLTVMLTGKEKKFKSLDHLAQQISQHGGPAAFRKKLVSQGYGHASVDDEEFGGKSYVGLSPEHFNIIKADGGSVTRAGGQIAPSKYLPNVPRAVHADGGRIGKDYGGAMGYVPQSFAQQQEVAMVQPLRQAQRQKTSTIDTIAQLNELSKMGGTKPTAIAPSPSAASEGHPPTAGVSDTARAAFDALNKGWSGAPITVESAYRDPALNEAVGGAKGSQHLHGNAYDIDTSGWTPEAKLALATQAYNSGFRGFGFYDNNLHFDVGGQRAWGPSYHQDSIPDWAQDWTQQYVYANGGGVGKEEGGKVEQMEQPANGMHMLRMRRAGINTKEDFWTRWRDRMKATAAPNTNISAIGSKDGHFQQIDKLINFHRQDADANGIRSVLQNYGRIGPDGAKVHTLEDGSMAAALPKAILQGAGIEPTIDNASQIYHSLPDDESGRVGKAGGGEMDGVESNNQNGVMGNEIGTAPLNLAPRAQAGELPNARGIRGSIGVLQAQDEASLEGLPTKVSIPLTGGSVSAGHDPRIRQIARNYMASIGLPYNPPTKYAKVDPKRASRIAAAYDEMTDNAREPLTKASYDAMIKETMAQYHAAKNAGFKAEFWNPDTEEDPYKASPRLATEDVRNNHHMWVYPTRSGYGSDGPITAKELEENPLLRDSGETWNGQPATVNDIFRAVHDYYGHAKEGVGFRGDGEENAWRSHASMYSPLARMAMTSETRGQNSWLNYGVHGEKNRNARTEDTVFAPQKVGILPHWAHHEGAEDFMGPEEVNAMAAIRKVHGRADGGRINNNDNNPAPDIKNPMSIFPKPQRMFPEDQRPKGGQYISAHNKADVTGHKAEAATIGIGPNGKPFFQASQNAVDQTGTVGKGSATTKTNLFKQKAGWKWQDVPEGHENTETIVSVEHRGKHFYALNAHFPKGVDLARYENATSEPRLRPTTQGNVTLGPQAGSISVRGKMHPVYHHVVVKADGGAVDAALALTHRFTKNGAGAIMALKPKGK